MIGIDFETYLINSQATPPAVCLTAAPHGCILHAVLETTECTSMLNSIFKGEWCAHNVAFDACVAVANFPVMDEIWESFRAGRAHCTLTREKLLNMGDTRERGKAHGVNYGVDLASYSHTWDVEAEGRKRPYWRSRARKKLTVNR